MVQSETRIFALDGLRGIAAIMVVAWHLTGSMVSRDGWTEGLYAATIFGRSGVDLFFVLSGFLIVGILVDRRNSENLFEVFYIRRACRILPPYLILIALYWICFAIVGQSDAFTASGMPWTLFAQLGFAWNVLASWFDNPIARGFSITWSVAIEEHFYLIFPFLIWWCPREKIARLLIVTGLLSWAGRAGFHLAYPDWINPPYMFTPFRLDGLCVGGLLALGYRNAVFRMLAERHREKLAAAAVSGAISVPLVVAAIRNDLFWHMYLWGHAYLTAVYGLVIAAILFCGSRFRMLQLTPLRLAGRYSYSLYLFHSFFLSLFFWGRCEQIITWYEGGLTLASLLATVVFCAILYELVEKRFQAFGHRYRYRKSEPVELARASA